MEQALVMTLLDQLPTTDGQSLQDSDPSLTTTGHSPTEPHPAEPSP
jgi:hypothetical protein